MEVQLSLKDIKEINVRIATEDDKKLPAYDHTYFSNLCQCPTWGLVRYGHHKTMSSGGRAMALEAGSASHDMFAAIRLLELLDAGLEGHFFHHGRRIFGDERWPSIHDNVIDGPGGARRDGTTDRLNLVLTALHTSGFYDDPRDKRRTLTTIEESGIAYFDRWEWGRRPVWVRNPDDPTSDVGIECAVEMVLSFVPFEGETIEFRYTGRADGIHHRNRTNSALVVHENKTGSRIDDSWIEGMRMTHQITGYAVWCTTFTGEPCNRAMAIGMAIPLPKSYDYGGIVFEPLNRDEHHVHAWFDWCLYCYQLDRRYRDNPLDAPRFTHSCNRYFRSCSFLPLCNSPREEQEVIFKEMEVDKWDPLQETQA